MIEEVGLLDKGPSIWSVACLGTMLWLAAWDKPELHFGILLTASSVPKNPFYSSHSLTPVSLGVPTDSCME